MSNVKISQCMIVKNEERNIARALTWGKGIVYEQIVVDTGSADRTVEIAESMGAKVLHLEWANDFSAPKNYAIEQATGDWIACLDADEYFPEGDAEKVLQFLQMIHSDAALRKKHLAVFCPIINVDDNDCPQGVHKLIRLFRNLPEIRWTGKIHEWLDFDWDYAVSTEDFKVIHTGYSDSAYKQTGKTKRNIEILRSEVRDNPDELNFKAYLADSLLADALKGTGGGAELEEAMSLYMQVLESDGFVLPDLKKNVYKAVLDRYVNAPGADPKLDGICDEAYGTHPDDPLFMCYKAVSLNKNGDYGGAVRILRKCEADYADAGGDKVLTKDIMRLLASQMVFAAQELGDLETVTAYAAILLMGNKANADLLPPFIATLIRRQLSPEQVIEQLAAIYDLNNKNDLLLIARAAKNCGAAELARMIIGIASGIRE